MQLSTEAFSPQTDQREGDRHTEMERKMETDKQCIPARQSYQCHIVTRLTFCQIRRVQFSEARQRQHPWSGDRITQLLASTGRTMSCHHASPPGTDFTNPPGKHLPLLPSSSLDGNQLAHSSRFLTKSQGHKIVTRVKAK